MDTTPLRDTYAAPLVAAALPGLGEPDDGGWNADLILAHRPGRGGARGGVRRQEKTTERSSRRSEAPLPGGRT
jgi:hypothetical protein